MYMYIYMWGHSTQVNNDYWKRLLILITHKLIVNMQKAKYPELFINKFYWQSLLDLITGIYFINFAKKYHETQPEKSRARELGTFLKELSDY